MKNKSVLYTFLGIILVVVGYVVGTALFNKPNHNTVQSNQTEKKQIQVGFLQLISHEALDTIYRGFVEELDRLGYKNNDKISIQFQNAQGNQSHLATMSEKLSKETDILVATTTPAAISLAKTTNKKPILLAGVSYPVQSGLMKTEERSENNVTGIAHRTPVQEQFEVMLQIMPQLKKVGVIYTSSEDNAVLQIEEAKAAAKKLGLTLELATITNTNDLQQVTESLVQKVEAIFLPIDNTIASAMPTVISVTDKQNIPVFPSAETMVAEGGVLTLSVDQYTIGVEAAKVAIKLFEGQNPSTMPLMIPSADTVYLNEEKASQLKLTIPETIKNKAKRIKNK